MKDLYINQYMKGKPEFWRFIVGILILAFLTQFVGAVPYTILAMISIFTNDITNGVTLDMNVMKLEGIPQLLTFTAIMVPFILAIICFPILMKYMHRRSFKTLITPYDRINYKLFFHGIVIGVVLMSLGTFIEYLIFPDTFACTFNAISFFTALPVIIVLIFFQASAEELFFRGYMLQNLNMKIKNQNINILIISLAFMSLHMMNPEVIKAFQMGWIELITMVLQYFIVSWLYAKITLMSNSLELAIAIHITNNVYLSTIIGYQGSVLDMDTTIFYSTNFSPIFSFIALVVMNFAMYYLFKLLVYYKYPDRIIKNTEGQTNTELIQE